MTARLNQIRALLISGFLALSLTNAFCQKQVNYVQVVKQAVPAVQLTSSSSAVSFGTAVQFTAHLSGSGAPPTGQVIFMAGTTELGTASLNGGGIAILQSSTLAVGVYAITARYGGDKNYTVAVSSQINETIFSVSTISLVLSSAGAPVVSVPSGTVVRLAGTVLVNGATLNTGTVNFCDASATYCTDIHRLGTAQLTNSGVAAIQFVPGIGIHNYKAVFAGTSKYPMSSSSSISLTVTGISSSTTTITQGGSLGNYSLTATVAGAAMAPPEGTVSFLDTSNQNAILGSAPLSSGEAGLSMLNFSNPAVSQGLDFVVTGDFNGDGILDLAAADFENNQVSVLLGNGNGIFTAIAANSQTGNNPISMATGDFNGDGILDLAVSNYGDGTVTILLGNGDGTFAAPTNVLRTGPRPDSIAVGDFNRDGNLDIAVANFGSNSITVLLGDGNGSFTPVLRNLVTGNEPAAIATGDFNGDGIPDLAVANFGDGTVTILLGDGAGSFTATPASPMTGSEPNSIVVSDLNEDGNADLVVANYLSDSVTVLLGNGDGTFETAKNLGTGSAPYSAAVADFNGDGIPDIATANYGDNTVTILTGDGTGAFVTSATPQAGQYPISLAVGDFNGDGRPDLAVVNYYDVIMSVLLAESAQTATVEGIVPQGGGTHLVEANYPGDGNYNSSISSTVGLTGQLLPPRLTLVSSVNNAYASTPVTFTATIGNFTTPAIRPKNMSIQSMATMPTPTGSVTFLNGSSVLGKESLNSNGVATYTATRLPVGKDSITASYGGDLNYSPVTSSTVVVSVDELTTPSITVTPSSTSITTTQPLIVSVAVSGGSGNPTPTGSVILSSGSYTSAPVSVAASISTINIPAGVLAVGTDILTVSYTPDTASLPIYNIASGSSQVAVSLATQVTPVLTVTPSATSITTAQALTLTIAVSGGGGNPTPTGSVTLSVGNNVFASAYLVAGSVIMNIPAGTLPLGSDTLNVSYAPNLASSSIYLSASGDAVVMVTIPVKTTPAVTITLSSQSITVAQPLTVIVNVNGGAGSPQPTGSLTLSSGSYSSTLTTFISSSATIIIPAGSLAAGSDIINGAFAPDSTSSVIYNPSSNSATVAVAALTPSFAISGTAVTVAPGENSDNTSTISITPSGGFTGAVALTATITSAPGGVTYLPALSFGATSPVNITGTASQSSILTVTTTATTSSSLVYPKEQRNRWDPLPGVMLPSIFLFLLPFRKNRWRKMLGMLALLAATTGSLVACGGGSPLSTVTIPGNTAGPYTITVTGTSGSIVVTTSVKLTVE